MSGLDDGFNGYLALLMAGVLMTEMWRWLGVLVGNRLDVEGAPFQMAHTPLKMTIPEVHREVAQAWSASYSSARITEALDSISHKSVEARIIHLIARLFFRGIYFPQMGWWAWIKVLAQNRQTIFKLVGEALGAWRRARRKKSGALVPADETSLSD